MKTTPENTPPPKPQPSEVPDKKGVGSAATCSEPLYVLEQRFKPGWYLEWWGDGEGGPYWTNDIAKAEKLTMKKALYEQGMLREVTLIVPNVKCPPTGATEKEVEK